MLIHWGRCDYRGSGYEFSIILCPRRDITPKGMLIAGYHIRGIVGRGFFSIQFLRVR